MSLCNTFRLFALTIVLSIIDTPANTFTISRTSDVNENIDNLEQAESINLQVRDDFRRLNDISIAREERFNPTTESEIEDSFIGSLTTNEDQTSSHSFETLKSIDVTTQEFSNLGTTENNDSEVHARWSTTSRERNNSDDLETTETKNIEETTIPSTGVANDEVDHSKYKKYGLISQNISAKVTQTLPSWKKYTSINRKSMETQDDISEAKNRSDENMMTDETGNPAQDPKTGDIPSLNQIKNFLSFFKSDAQNDTKSSKEVTGQESNAPTSDKETPATVESKRGGFLDFSLKSLFEDNDDKKDTSQETGTSRPKNRKLSWRIGSRYRAKDENSAEKQGRSRFRLRNDDDKKEKNNIKTIKASQEENTKEIESKEESQIDHRNTGRDRDSKKDERKSTKESRENLTKDDAVNVDKAVTKDKPLETFTVVTRTDKEILKEWNDYDRKQDSDQKKNNDSKERTDRNKNERENKNNEQSKSRQRNDKGRDKDDRNTQSGDRKSDDVNIWRTESNEDRNRLRSRLNKDDSERNKQLENQNKVEERNRNEFSERQRNNDKAIEKLRPRSRNDENISEIKSNIEARTENNESREESSRSRSNKNNDRNNDSRSRPRNNQESSRERNIESKKDKNENRDERNHSQSRNNNERNKESGSRTRHDDENSKERSYIVTRKDSNENRDEKDVFQYRNKNEKNNESRSKSRNDEENLRERSSNERYRTESRNDNSENRDERNRLQSRNKNEKNNESRSRSTNDDQNSRERIKNESKKENNQSRDERSRSQSKNNNDKTNDVRKNERTDKFSSQTKDENKTDRRDKENKDKTLNSHFYSEKEAAIEHYTQNLFTDTEKKAPIQIKINKEENTKLHIQAEDNFELTNSQTIPKLDEITKKLSTIDEEDEAESEVPTFLEDKTTSSKPVHKEVQNVVAAKYPTDFKFNDMDSKQGAFDPQEPNKLTTTTTPQSRTNDEVAHKTQQRNEINRGQITFKETVDLRRFEEKQYKESIPDNDIQTTTRASTVDVDDRKTTESEIEDATPRVNVKETESIAQMNEDAIKEELLKEEVINNYEENMGRYKAAPVDTTTQTTIPVRIYEVTKPFNVNDKKSNTDEKLSVKPLSLLEKLKSTILYPVSSNYKPPKKIDVQPSKTFVRDPDDNSWRNESLSSLGIVFNPKNSSKPLTQVLKNKTETELNNNLLEKSNKNETPDLRERLEKIAERRKTKKKKTDVYGNDVYNDYEENSKENTVSKEKEFIISTTPSIKLTTKMTTTTATSTTTTTSTTTSQPTTTKTAPTDTTPSPPKLTIQTPKKIFNVAEYYDTSDEDDADYLRLAKVDLKKHTVPLNQELITPPTWPITNNRGVHNKHDDRRPTLQYFPPLTTQKVIYNTEYDNDFNNKMKAYTYTEPPTNVIPVEYTRTTTLKPRIQHEHVFTPDFKSILDTPLTTKPIDIDKDFFMTPTPGVTVGKEPFTFVTDDGSFNKASDVIKHYRDFLNAVAKDHEEDKNVGYTPYTQIPTHELKGVTPFSKPYTKPDLSENYDYDTDYKKDALQRFVHNFNHHDDRFKVSLPLLYNNSIIHSPLGEGGRDVASSRALQGTLVGRPAPDCDNATVELAPAYELHYYVPDQEEREVADPKPVTAPYPYRL